MKSLIPRAGIVGLIGLLAVAGAGCSTNKASPSANGTKTSTTAVPPSSKPGATTIPYNASKNARADVTVSGTCLHEPNGAWVLSGTVNNTTAKKAGFTIVVDYVTQPGGTVLDTKIVKVPAVAPNKSAPWGVAWVNSGADIGCVVRQAQFS